MVEISTSVLGVEKEISFSRQENCDTCHGTGSVTRVVNSFLGQMQTSSPCPKCNGTGKVIVKPCSHCGGSGLHKEAEEISSSSI